MLRVRGITGKYSNKLLGPYIFIPFSGLFVLIYILGTVFLNVDNGFYNNKKKFPNPFIFLIHINECHPFGHYYLAAFTPAKKTYFSCLLQECTKSFFSQKVHLVIQKRVTGFTAIADISICILLVKM